MSTALRLLILEDEPLEAELEVATLEEAGYTCQWERAETQAEFLSRLDTLDYDIVLADYDLPASDGLTALHLFLERDLDLPFIYVSGTMGEETAIESIKAGATDYVLKERLARLGSVVKRALREGKEHRQRKQAEEELQKSQQLLKAIVGNSPVAIQVKDLQGRYLLINNQIEMIFDLQQQKVVGKTPHDFFPSEVADRFLADDQAALQAGTAVQTEETVPFPDGMHTFVALKFPLVDETGEPYAVAGISTDITERVRSEEKRARAEEMLRQSDLRFRSLVEQTTDAVFCYEYDPPIPTNLPIEEQIKLFYTGVLAECNDVAARSYGATRAEEVVGKRLTELFGTSVGSLDAFFRTFIQSDYQTVDLESTEVLSDGTKRNYLNNGYGVVEDDKLLRVWGTFRDITDRKRAEETLRFTQFAVDRSADPVFWMGADAQFVYVNDAACQRLGYSREELLTMTVHDIDPDFPREVWKDHWREVKERGSFTFESHHRTKDGQDFPVEITVNFLEFEGKEYNCAFARDITERKQTEKERERLLTQIQEQAQRVQQIIDTVPEGVILLDTDSRIILANPLGREDLTVLADTLVGGTLTRLGDRPLPTILTSPPRGLWHEVTAEERVFQVIARPIEIGPTPRGWVLVIHEVTQQREFERRAQQQERLAAVGQLAAGIAHDFNNIMAVISLYAGMSLRSADLPAKVCERLETIDQQAQRAGDLIQQILDFSRRAVLERQPMELMIFLKEQAKLLRRTLPENIQIDLDVGEDEYMVNADPTRVQQAIMNLATNARDAMPEGGQLRIGLAKVQISERKNAPLPEMGPGEWVRVTVADTGTGIPPDILPHIYDPFFTTKPAGMGTGLGLSQVYGIVKQHEGHIDVATQEREGTIFTIYLPAIAPQRPEPPRYGTDKLVQGQGQTILVVEDDDATRAALVDSLELLDYRVVETSNGQEALSILEQHADRPPTDPEQEIALVLSDMVMPGMGGRALFHALRQRNLAAKVVLLTGHPLDEEELEGLRSQGLGGWLLKPLSIERLSQVVARALEEE